MNNGTLLEVTKISVSFDQRQILKGISFSVSAGEIVTLIGPNGSGKTTLSRVALGLLIPDNGKVTLKPSLIIGYMPQKLPIDQTLPLTVERLLRLQLKKKAQLPIFFRTVEEMGIQHLLHSQIHELSGGEMQRVMLARALLPSPDLLVLDEPVQGVDVQGQSEFYQLIEYIRNRYHTGILMVSHDLHMVMKTTDHVICINHHICCEGSPEDVSKHPAYQALFGAEAVNSIGIYAHHHDHAHDLHGDVVR